jgi:type II secretory pathway pseudopilin PulG
MSTETLFLIEIVAGLMIMATILTAVSTAMTANTLKRIEQLLAQRNSN